MEYTTNYQLPTWVKEDRIRMEDFNDMTDKLDAALGTVAKDIAAKGNCQIYITSYVGTGASGAGGPNTLTFPNAPLLVLIHGGNSNAWGAYSEKMGIILQGTHIFVPQTTTVALWPTTWSPDRKTVSWYSVNSNAEEQMNTSGSTYTVIALLTTSA